jgi:hypothetical protein
MGRPGTAAARGSSGARGGIRRPGGGTAGARTHALIGTTKRAETLSTAETEAAMAAMPIAMRESWGGKVEAAWRARAGERAAPSVGGREGGRRGEEGGREGSAASDDETGARRRRKGARGGEGKGGKSREGDRDHPKLCGLVAAPPPASRVAPSHRTCRLSTNLHSNEEVDEVGGWRRRAELKSDEPSSCKRLIRRAALVRLEVRVARAWHSGRSAPHLQRRRGTRGGRVRLRPGMSFPGQECQLLATGVDSRRGESTPGAARQLLVRRADSRL